MTDPAVDLAHARSFLFVPGSRPDRFEKALASGADVVVLDLEDAVVPEEKGQALHDAVAWLGGGGRAVVRVNAVGTPWHVAEVDALAGRCPVMLPKAETPQDVASVAERVGGGVIALVETARGIRDVDAIASTGGVARLALGTVDLAADLVVDPSSWSALAYSRGRIVMASAAAGLPAPIDGVTTRLDDSEVLTTETHAARDLGFGAKLCVHPRQIVLVNGLFRPSEDEIQWAQRVLAGAAAGGVVVVDGAMVDAPVLLRARSILQRAE